VQHKKATWIDKTVPLCQVVFFMLHWCCFVYPGCLFMLHWCCFVYPETAPVQHKKDNLDRQNSTSAK
jgi:hypothetical protein